MAPKSHLRADKKTLCALHALLVLLVWSSSILDSVEPKEKNTGSSGGPSLFQAQDPWARPCRARDAQCLSGRRDAAAPRGAGEGGVPGGRLPDALGERGSVRKVMSMVWGWVWVFWDHPLGVTSECFRGVKVEACEVPYRAFSRFFWCRKARQIAI